MRSLATDVQSLIVDSGSNRRTTGSVAALKVLIVDDNDQYGDLLCALLSDAGHEPTVARDGTSGLHLARAVAPDAVLLDCRLPEMRGYELVRAMRTEGILPASSIVI